MKEYTRLAAIVVIVILATTLLGASFQMTNVRAQMPGFGSLFSSMGTLGSNSGSGDAGAGTGTGSGGEQGSSGSSGQDGQPIEATPSVQATPDTGEQPSVSDGKVKTVLSMAVPAEAVAGNEFPVSISLTENASGKPLAGVPVTISAGLFSHVTVTDDRGSAKANVSFSSAGNHTVLATFGGDTGFAGSSAARDVHIAQQPLLDWLSKLFVPLLMAVIVIVTIALVAIVAYLAIKKVPLPKKAKTPADVTGITVRPVPGPDTGYRIEFEGIESPLPAVWGIDEPLRVRLAGPGDCQSSLGLFVDGEQVDTVRMTGGIGFSSLAASKGDHLITVMVDSEILAESVLRIVDYREEIVRIFNGFYTSAGHKFGEIPGDATPRELQWMISDRLSREHRNSLDRIISTFEIANYSMHAVGRNDYVISYVSMQELKI